MPFRRGTEQPRQGTQTWRHQTAAGNHCLPRLSGHGSGRNGARAFPRSPGRPPSATPRASDKARGRVKACQVTSKEAWTRSPSVPLDLRPPCHPSPRLYISRFPRVTQGEQRGQLAAHLSHAKDLAGGLGRSPKSRERRHLRSPPDSIRHFSIIYAVSGHCTLYFTSTAVHMLLLLRQTQQFCDEIYQKLIKL